jgi:hypothetical protein
MITEEVGKLLVSTQDEIKFLKGELELLQNPFTNGTPTEYKQMLNRIREQLSNFENKITHKVDYLVNSEMVNHEDTLNKLPLIPRPESSANELLPRLQQASSTHFSESDKSKKQETKVDPRYLFMQKLTENPSSNITQKVLKDKFGIGVPLDSNNKMKPYSSLKPIYKSKTFGKSSKPVGILPKNIRDNPFAPAPIKEKDIKKGVLSMITRGLVPREVDLTPAFERGGTLFSNQRMTLHHHKDQFVRGEVSSVPGHFYNTKFDVKAFEQPSQPEPKPSSAPKYLQPIHLAHKSVPEVKSISGMDRNAQGMSIHGTSQREINLAVDKVAAKEYEEVVDAYSLHQFIIRRGKVLADTPEFQSYKRTYFGIWEPITLLIQTLEKILTDYDIRVAYIDGKKLARLAEISFGKPSIADLLGCIVNQDDVSKVIRIPQNMYKGTNGRNLAAIKIQSFWKMYRARKTYKRVKVLIDKVQVIQRCARLFLQHRKTLQVIKERKEENYLRYREISQKFKEDWPQNKYKKRVEIHIQSISCDELQRLSMEKFLQRQNAQIARLFALKDPLVDIIYIAPFDLPPEVLSYYSKVFELGGLEGFQNRYTILWPENHTNFPGHFPTSRILMYSPKVLNRIKQLIRGKVAYIVPSIPSNDDIELSASLNIPIFSGDPQKNALYSTKSGAKSIFNACEMPIPPGSYNIYDEKEFVLTLTKLIAYNFHVNLWLFKIDDEFNGRGHASFNVEQVKLLVDLRNRKLPVNEDLILKIHEIVSSILPMKIKITMPHLYRNYQEYITKFVQKGGVIEAAPNCSPSQISSSSVGFVIDPVGEVEVLGSYDKFFAHEYVACGYFSPQKSIPNLNLQALCETIGKALFEQGVFGYASIDIISFPDPATKKQDKKDSPSNRIFWAVDLNCYMTTYVASTLFFDFLMRGELDAVSGHYTIPRPAIEEAGTVNTKAQHDDDEENDGDVSEEKEKRCFMYCPFIFHSGLSSIQYKTFFHMCRMKGISYDLESKAGTTFILLDSLQTGVMGVITMGRYRRNVVKYMNDALNFIMSQAGQTEYRPPDANGENRPDTMYLTDVASRVRLIHRVFEKKHRMIN